MSHFKRNTQKCEEIYWTMYLDKTKHKKCVFQDSVIVHSTVTLFHWNSHKIPLHIIKFSK